MYVYVGQQARGNFDVGMNHLTWGWKHATYGPDVEEAMAWLRSPSAPTYLVFAREATTTATVPGWPRTKAGDMDAWQSATLRGMTIARLGRRLYTSIERLWPNDTYATRVGLSFVTGIDDVPAPSLAPDALLAVRNAVMLRGMPILGPAPFTDEGIRDLLGDDRGDLEATEDQVSDHLLSGLDDLDGVARALVRREQRRLRSGLLGRHRQFECALCRRLLPVGLIRLAHIKRRADATNRERLNSANTMPACTLGCDELFERGYLLISDRGELILNPRPRLTTMTEDLRIALRAFEGKTVGKYVPAQADFFRWHRDRHTVDRVQEPSA